MGLGLGLGFMQGPGDEVSGMTIEDGVPRVVVRVRLRVVRVRVRVRARIKARDIEFAYPELSGTLQNCPPISALT